jgi:hypothetical protein
MVKFTERDLAVVAGLAGAADFLSEGRFSAPVARALKRAIGKAVPVAARGVPRALGTARFVAMRHPYIAAAVVTYEVVKNREQISQLLNEGWQVIQPAVDPLLELTAPGRQELFETMQPRSAPFLPSVIEQFRPKRKQSTFNKAIKAGMAAIKKSTSYGGKGKIKPATKAFSIVTKLASAKKKKKKAPKGGIRRKIWNAMKGLR